MPSLENTKQRIKSVDTTRKITKAMQLVATAKFRKTAKGLIGKKEYYENVYKTVNGLISSLNNSPDFKKMTGEEVGGTAWIIINSAMGLCGGYNVNLNKEVKKYITPSDKLIICGSKGKSYWKKFNIVASSENKNDDVSYEETAELGEIAHALIQDKKVGKLKIAYTKFVNSVTFEPTIIDVWPIDQSQYEGEEKSESVIEFEPSPVEVLNQLMPLYINAMVYGAVSESKVSEQANRRNSMETATKNADELKQKLALEVNRVRQASITQELSEIIAGSEA